MAALAFASTSALVARPVAARPSLARRQARASVRVAASDRQLWLTGSEAPKHLDGSLPGDFGFDPLGLGSDPERLTW